MPNKKNKVKFNICNVHYAIVKLNTDGTATFETPVPMPGAVSLSLDPNGEPNNFYADGYAYYTISKYYCSASRPTIESQTNEDEIEVKTEKLSIKAAPLGNGLVKAKTGDDTTDAVYLNWYSEVYLPYAVTGGEPNP